MLKDTEVIRMHDYLKDSFDCSGYCQPSELFSFNIDILEGRPTKTCRDDLKQEMYLIFMFPAIISIIGAGTSAIAFTAQYWLWKDYSSTEKNVSELIKQRGGLGANSSQVHLESVKSGDVSDGPRYSDGMGNPENAEQQAEALA